MEKPAISILKPLALRIRRALWMNGAAQSMRVVITGAGEGVMSRPPACNLNETEIVPATVPVWMASGGADKASVEPIGMLKLAVEPPVEN